MADFNFKHHCAFHKIKIVKMPSAEKDELNILYPVFMCIVPASKQKLKIDFTQNEMIHIIKLKM